MLNTETRLCDLRTDKDLRQKDIADKLKVKRSTYSMWEINKSDFSIEKANELANFYKVSLDYLLGISDINTKTENSDINFDLLCTRLKSLRKEKNLTQSQLGKSVGFAQTTYTCYENGTSRPTTFKLLYIAKYYNVSFDYLVGRSDSKKLKSSL